MAAHGDHGDQQGTMDISHHQRTWKAFTKLVFWSAASIGLVMFLLLLFRTHG